MIYIVVAEIAAVAVGFLVADGYYGFAAGLSCGVMIVCAIYIGDLIERRR